MTSLCCVTVVLVVAAVAGTMRDLSLPVAVVVAVPAEAYVHVLRRHVYVSPASSPGSASTTLACGVHQLLSAESQWY
jgi:hypothetical protein